MSPTQPDDIAACVLDTFDALPSKFQPRKLADGRREWVPLAGIVLSRGEFKLTIHNILNTSTS
jgi:tRNA-specific adenosine deaminase 1